MLRFRVISPPTEDGFTVEQVDEHGDVYEVRHGSKMRGDTPGSLIDQILEDD